VREKEDTVKDEETGQEETETSLDEILAKKADEGAAAEDDGEEEPIVTPGSTDRVEALPAKVVPQQPTEFVCKKCFLVKHRSQLADRRRTICRDCA
jgi:hypothetical protein